MQVKSIASSSFIGAGVGAVLSDSGTGLDAGGQVVAGVGPDPLADPEGPTGVEGEPANGDPIRAPLYFLGLKGSARGSRWPKNLMHGIVKLLNSLRRSVGTRKRRALRHGPRHRRSVLRSRVL